MIPKCKGCHNQLPNQIDDCWQYIVRKESGQNTFSWIGPFCSSNCVSLWLRDLICQQCYKKINAHSSRSVRATTSPNGQRIGPFCNRQCETLWFRTMVTHTPVD